MENLVDRVELDARQLRAYVNHPVHDAADLEQIFEALTSTAPAVEKTAELGRAAYR